MISKGFGASICFANLSTMVEEPYVNHVPTCNYHPSLACIFSLIEIFNLIFNIFGGEFRYRRSRL